MTDMNALFARRKVNTEQLLSFGFTEDKNGYSYPVDLVDGQFTMTITITDEGKVSEEVVDNASGENYVLHRIAGATGAFVGRIRDEYERIMAQIVDTCFEPDVFKSENAKQVIQYVREKYQDELEFLWQRFPDNAIFRRKDTEKWYAALLIIQKEKLGLDKDGSIEILDLRMKPEDINEFVDGKRYFPGYHMNKKYWITICLNGSVPLDEIFCRIDESFELAIK